PTFQAGVISYEVAFARWLMLGRRCLTETCHSAAAILHIPRGEAAHFPKLPKTSHRGRAFQRARCAEWVTQSDKTGQNRTFWDIWGHHSSFLEKRTHGGFERPTVDKCWSLIRHLLGSPREIKLSAAC